MNKPIISKYAEYSMTQLPRKEAEEMMILARRINYLSIEHSDDVVELIERDNLGDVDNLEKVIGQLAKLNAQISY